MRRPKLGDEISLRVCSLGPHVLPLTLPDAAVTEEEEIGWDEESDDEASSKAKADVLHRPRSTESSTTLHPPPKPDASTPRPVEGRKSDEKSQSDSEASYDVVGAASGVPSHAPDSPRGKKTEDSEEEDWE